VEHILALGLTLVVSSAAVVPPELSPWEQFPVVELAEDIPGVETVTLLTLWRLDCGNDAETLVGRIVSAAPGRDGCTLLLDAQLAHVLVVGPDGVVERTVGKPGDGPGDLPGAYRAFQLSDGRIGVTGGAPALAIQVGGMGRIVLLDRMGNPAGTWYAAGDPGTRPISSVRELRCANDHILSASQRMNVSATRSGRVLELATIDPVAGTRSIVARLVFADEMSDASIREADFYEPFADGRCDISTTGRVAFAPLRNQWQAVIVDPSGEGIVLERPWEPVSRSPEELAAAQAALGTADHHGLFKNRPSVGRLRWRPNGNLWIEVPGVELASGSLACFDELDPAGRLLRRIVVRGPGDREHDQLVVMENGQFALLRGFKADKTVESVEPVSTEVLLLGIADH